MTQELFAKILASLEKVVGPVIAQLVLNIIIREAKLEFNDEQEAQLNLNRLRALEARADELTRSGLV